MNYQKLVRNTLLSVTFSVWLYINFIILHLSIFYCINLDFTPLRSMKALAGDFHMSKMGTWKTDTKCVPGESS